MLTVRGNLEHYAKICGLSPSVATFRANQALNTLGLMGKQHELVWHLSAGQRQKVSLAMAFLVRTPIVFLDEPTVHLDPNVASEVRHFIRDILNRQLGQTVVMSTHYVREAEMLCDRVGILHEGKMLATGTVSDLVTGQTQDNLWEARILNHHPNLEKQLEDSGRYEQILVNIVDPNQGRASIRFSLNNSGDAVSAIRSDLEDVGVRIQHIKKALPSLEEVYVGMVQKEDKSA
jgi:ABC-2 type transport system ATP-binding protein